MVGRRGGPGWPWQRQVPEQQAPGTYLRRAGRGGRGAVAAPRVAPHGRCGPRGISERRQEHTHLEDFGGEAPDSRLPLHDVGTQPWGGSAGGTTRVRGSRHSRPHRGRQRGEGTGPPVPTPHRTCARPPGDDRPGTHRPGGARAPVRGPARRAGCIPAGAPGPTTSDGRIAIRRGRSRRRFRWREDLGHDRRGPGSAGPPPGGPGRGCQGGAARGAGRGGPQAHHGGRERGAG